MSAFDDLEAALPLADGWAWWVGRQHPSTNPADPAHQHRLYRAHATGHDGDRYITRDGFGDTPEEAIAALLESS